MQGPPPTLRPDTCDVPSHLSTNLRSRGSLLWGNFDMLFCRDLGILSPIPGHKFQGAMWGKRKKDTVFSPCLHPQRDDVQKYHLLLQRQRQYKHLISNNLLGGACLNFTQCGSPESLGCHICSERAVLKSTFHQCSQNMTEAPQHVLLVSAAQVARKGKLKKLCQKRLWKKWSPAYAL